MTQSYQPRATQSNTLGVIFAGGRARRLGQAKSSIDFAGEPLLSRIEDRLKTQSFDQAISVREPASVVSTYTEIIDSDKSGQAGPIIGVLSALKWACSVRGCCFLLTTPVDTPFLPRNIATTLWAGMERTGAKSAVAVTGGHVHGLSALYDVSIFPTARKVIADNGQRMIKMFHQDIGSAHVSFEAQPVDPFFNINTKEDLGLARQWAKAHPEI